MPIRQISLRTSVLLAMAVALFWQSQHTLRYANAQEKIKMVWVDKGVYSDEEAVKALEELGATTWFYSCKYATDTSQCEDIMKNVISKSSIDVCPYIGSTGAKWLPGHDYVGAAEYFAELSLRYPNKVIGYSLDDMKPLKNRWVNFTPENITEFMDAKDRINSHLKFWPVLYYDVHDDFSCLMEDSPYNSALRDGATLWYWASYNGNFTNLKTLQNYLTTARQNVHPRPFITGIYPIMYGRMQNSIDANRIFYHPDTLRKMLQMSLDSSDGVVLFSLPVWLNDTASHFALPIYQKQQNDDRNFDFKLSNGGTATARNWYQRISTTISVPSNLIRAQVYFEIKDNVATDNRNLSEGQMRKQLLVNNVIVWEADAKGDGKEKVYVNQDIMSRVKPGSKAVIAIRLLNMRKLPWQKYSVYIGGIEIRINNNTIKSSFEFGSGILHIAKWVEIYNICKEVFGGSGPSVNHGKAIEKTGKLSLCDFSHVYTNRFDRSTVFGYRLPAKSNVSLKIYDMAGRLLTSLVDGDMSVGYHSVKWNTTGVTPSVYFVNLKSGEQNVVSRVVGF